MGNTPQHPPQKRTLNSWRKAPAFPTKVKTRDRGEEAAVAWGLPRALSPPSLKASKGQECLPPARAALQLPENSRSPVPSCSPTPPSSHSPSVHRPQGQAFTHLRIFAHAPYSSLHPGHCGALSPHLNPFPLRCQLRAKPLPREMQSTCWMISQLPSRLHPR